MRKQCAVVKVRQERVQLVGHLNKVVLQYVLLSSIIAWEPARRQGFMDHKNLLSEPWEAG